MFRIGILGSDNSHALAFAKLCNFPDENGKYAYDDVRICAIYGKDDDVNHTKEVAKEGNIEFIASAPENFIGKVDAVMIVNRRGSYHVPDILPFIEKGYPVWIDKPVASSVEDIEKLESACKKHNALITGGSTIKYNHEIISTQNRIKSGAFGEVLGGNMNFPADLESEYEGINFYGPHLVDMMLATFGYNPKSVVATATKNNCFAAIVKYENFHVTLNFVSTVADYHITVYGSEKVLTIPMEISTIYKLAFDKFVWMLRNREMPLSFEKLTKHVYVLDAISRSISEKKEIIL